MSEPRWSWRRQVKGKADWTQVSYLLWWRTTRRTGFMAVFLLFDRHPSAEACAVEPISAHVRIKASRSTQGRTHIEHILPRIASYTYCSGHHIPALLNSVISVCRVNAFPGFTSTIDTSEVLSAPPSKHSTPPLGCGFHHSSLRL